MSVRYFGSSLPEDISRERFTHPAIYADGIWHVDDGWHFVTEDQDSYGPYDTEEECVQAAALYARSI